MSKDQSSNFPLELHLLESMLNGQYNVHSIQNFFDNVNSFGNIRMHRFDVGIFSCFFGNYKNIALNNPELAKTIGLLFINNIEKYSRIKQQDNNGYTALHWLIDSDPAFLTPEIMLKLNSLKDVPDNMGITAFNWLFIYCSDHQLRQYFNDYIKIMEILVNNGANTDIVFYVNAFPIKTTAIAALYTVNNNLEFTDFIKFATGLIDIGVTFDKPESNILDLLLYTAQKYFNLPEADETKIINFIKSCFAKGYDPHYKTRETEEGLTSICAEFKSASLLKELLEFIEQETEYNVKELIDKPNVGNVTTLEWMFEYCNQYPYFKANWLDIAKILLKYGADHEKIRDKIKQHKQEFDTEKYESWYEKVFPTNIIERPVLPKVEDNLNTNKEPDATSETPLAGELIEEVI